MRIAVFGATGRTGRPLVEQAVERGHEVVAFVRDMTGLSPAVRNDDRVIVVEGDAYSGEGVERAIVGDGDPVDAVVSVLAQSSEGPDHLLTEAGRHMLAAMNRHGVERAVGDADRHSPGRLRRRARFVTLVGAGIREEGESVNLGGRMMGVLLKLLARSVLEDARDQVELIKDSDTRWTVVRAPRLTENAHTGEFHHGTDLSLGMRDTAARANVAEFILDCLEGNLYVHEMPKVADV
ncbi:NAD(P)-dependent oxidoreductase [Halorubrum rubrum]|uniref:NAD(P)-dependent oxidoreductase n=1 Tax=Halorubrum rubrum TaxID=1126240 RepID=A0ABD5R0V1_9EURY|nr:NAD(P)H-binding protein [Halorubrum rubrum]